MISSPFSLIVLMTAPGIAEVLFQLAIEPYGLNPLLRILFGIWFFVLVAVALGVVLGESEACLRSYAQRREMRRQIDQLLSSL